MLHLIPASALTAASSIEVSALRRFLGVLHPISGLGVSERYNLDGYITYSHSEGSDQDCAGYVLLMRNGIIEAVDTGPYTQTEKERLIRSHQFDEELFPAFDAYRKVQLELGLSDPTFVLLTLVGVEGYRMAVSDMVKFAQSRLYLIDRDVLVLPDILIESPANAASTPALLRPALDALWQASGYARSENYGEDGTWRLHK